MGAGASTLPPKLRQADGLSLAKRARKLVPGGEAGLEEGLMHCDFFLDNLQLHVRPATFIAAGNLWKETDVQTAL